MREFIAGTQKVRLNERDYKQLLKRFNPAKAEDGCICVKCICCFYSGCTLCPLKHCSLVLCELELLPKFAELTTETVFLDMFHKEEAVEEIRAIHQFLLSLEKVAP